MTLPLHIAEKFLLLKAGERIPASKLKHTIIDAMLAEGILYKPGKHKSHIHLISEPLLALYLQQNFSIHDLPTYIETLKKVNLTRADLVAAAADSKLKSLRTFKGFLVNCFSRVSCTLNGEAISILPTEGTFHFIYDFETFVPSLDITIVGIENPENFRYINKQKEMFKHINPLFVSRYPQNQSKDLIRWLKTIPNNYLHFGDFDFAGIGIYLNEFKPHLGNKAMFFTPDDIDNNIKQSGSKSRYDGQKPNYDITKITEGNVLLLIDSIHRHKKGLDQEIFILQ